LQTWWINQYETPIFLKWLEFSLLNGTLRDPMSGRPLPFAKLAKFQKHKFRPRRWPWVDPQKDAQANIEAVNNRLKSRSQVIEETSQETYEEIILEQKKEQDLAKAAGVELPAVAGAAAKNPDKTETQDDDPKGAAAGAKKN
jgi:capsid protein